MGATLKIEAFCSYVSAAFPFYGTSSADLSLRDSYNVAPFMLVSIACDALRAVWLAACKTLEAIKLERLEGKKRTAELVLDPVNAVTQPKSPTERADTKIRLLSSSAFA